MAVRNLQDNIKPVMGMATDSHPINQPPNTYRYALNMLLESREGDHSAVTTEEGNIECDNIKDGYRIIGTILISNNDVIIFSTNEIKSEIGLLSDGCEYTPLIESSCLSFSRDYPITGIFKIHNGCDRIIYFTDNFNPFRAINLDNLISYTNLDMSNEHVSVVTANLTDDWNCELFNLTPNYTIPNIDLNQVIDGAGALLEGTYRFAFRYTDADFNPTSWAIIDQPISVTAGQLSTFNSIDGGNFDLTGNVLFNSSKAISLDITNLDMSYAYYQLAVLETNLGDENNILSYELTAQPISATTSNYTYRGYTTEKTAVSIDSILIDSISFNTVKALAQIDNRLIIGNTSEDNRDWSEFQQAASQIITSWHMFDKVKDDGASSSGSTKSPHFSFENKGYMRDEVYAFGIVYVFKDGTESPVFHIPGRQANKGVFEFSGTVFDYTNQQLVDQGNDTTAIRNQVPSITDGDLATENWDTQMLEVVAATTVVDPKREVDERNVEHIPITEFGTPSGLKVGNTIARWKVFNTATLVDEYYGGVMSYYECDEVYPNVTTCSGDSIWGDDYWGDPLVGTPIRHHKFPDSGIALIHSGTEDLDAAEFKPQPPNGFIWTVSINVANVNYPVSYASDIQGYHIVRVKRDENNSTVIDKGLGVYPDGFFNSETGDTYNTPTFAGNTRNLAFVDTTRMLNVITPKTQFRGDIVGNKYIKFEYQIDIEQFNAPDVSGIVDLGTRTMHDVDDAIRLSDAYVYVDPDTVQVSPSGFVTDISNNTTVRRLFYHFTDELVDLPNIVGAEGTGGCNWYVAVKQWAKPYGNLFGLKYQKCNNSIMTTTGVVSSLERFVFGGDCFVSELTFNAGLQPSGGFGATRAGIVNNFYMESTINSELRCHGTQPWEDHYRRFVGTWDDWRFLVDGDSNVPFDYFKYNSHYSQEATEFVFFPLPINWDYCYNCNGRFPYRLWYSERAYQEEQADNYRQFLANNYHDLQGDTGEVNKLFVYKDELYAQTDNATWFVSTRPQQLNTNEGNIQVGTGDIFSTPPKRIETVDRGYAGTKHPFATIVTEFGTFFVDADAGKIFSLSSQGLQDITNKGMRNWFAENLPLNIAEQITNFNWNAITSKNGAGFIATLDPRHNRIILYKKDYRLIGDAQTVLTTSIYEDPAPLAYGFNTTTGEFYSWDNIGNEEVIENLHADPELVEDLSWTISFSLMHNAWASYHSYRPDWMWNNRNNFYTYKYGNVEDQNYIWKHGTRNYNSFYSATSPSIIELIFNSNPTVTKVYNSIGYISKAEALLGRDFVEIPYETFNKAFLYNSKQSSGLLNVIPKQLYNDSNPFVELTYDYSTIYARENEDSWSISEFYNMVVDNTKPLITTDWNDANYQAARVLTGELSYPNSLATDFAKGDFQLDPLRDKWLGLRLWYDNNNSYKLTTEFVSSLNNISYK